MRGTFVVAAAMTVLAVPIRGNGQAFAPAPGGGPSKLLFGVRVLLEFESIRQLANQPHRGSMPTTPIRFPFLGSPAKHLEPHACTPCANESQRLCRLVREVDEDAGGLRAGRGAAIDHAHVNAPPVRQVRHAKDRTERIARMRGHELLHVEADAACRRASVKLLAVVGRESFPDFKGRGCRRRGRPRCAGCAQQRWNHHQPKTEVVLLLH